MQAGVASEQTFRTPERFAGAREIPEFTIGTPIGVFSIFAFDDKTLETLEFQSTLDGFLYRFTLFVFILWYP
jgi:hypothetical protein